MPSGSVSVVKEPGHFEVRKFSSQVTRVHFFPQKNRVNSLKDRLRRLHLPSLDFGIKAFYLDLMWYY